MTAKKTISRSRHSKNDGKQILTSSCNKSKTNAVKYTLWRTPEDIKNLEKLRHHLKNNLVYSKFVNHNSTWNTDSGIYKNLPDLYLNAVKKVSDQQLAIDELTAKLDELEDLRTSFCRIFEICELKK
jgi:hypothetical protein